MKLTIELNPNKFLDTKLNFQSTMVEEELLIIPLSLFDEDKPFKKSIISIFS